MARLDFYLDNKKLFDPGSVADSRPQPTPRAMKWQENGELASSDLFQLIQRLKEVESADHSNELWRLGHKYPNG